MRLLKCYIALSAALASAGYAAPLDAEAIVSANQGAVLVITGQRSEAGTVVQGSGVCIAPAGYVLATAHQVKDVESIEGRLAGGQRFALEVIAVHPDTEYALLKAEQALPEAVPLGNADTLRAGAPLVSIAAPQNLEFSTVTGTVANPLRTYSGIPVLQAAMTAAEGSSGGPVFDRTGALVGLITGTFEEMPFVLINRINNAYPLLRAHGLMPAEPSLIGEIDNLPLLPASGLDEAELRAVHAYNKGVRAASASAKMQAYQIATRLLPAFYEAWFNLGVAATASGELEQAERAYLRALELRSNAVEAHRNLGRLYLRQGRDSRAIAAFDTAARLAPGEAQSYNDLGEAYRRSGRLEGAVEAFQKAIALRPDYAPAHFNLGLVYTALGHPGKAASQFRKYLALAPDAGDTAVVRQWIQQLPED